MSVATAGAILAREVRRIDVPRALLAVLAAAVCGRLAAGAGFAVVSAGIFAAAFAASQISFKRESAVPIAYLEAPLRGIDLALALSAVPCAVALAIGLAFAAGAATRDALSAAEWLAGAEAAPLATLIMQSAALRAGGTRLVYRCAAALAAGAIVALGATTGPIAGAAACATLSLLALRGFGATLMRFDPVVSPT